MHIRQVINKTERIVKDNSPAILTALGVSGVLSTAYLAHEAGVKSSEQKHKYGLHGKSTKDQVRALWKNYIPTAVSATVAVGCIIAASRMGSRKTAAITAAYSISERAFSEYKEKVIEKFGDKKEQQVRDELAQERVNKAELPKNEVLVVGPGTTLCCEAFTGRYFNSDMETLRKVMNDINAQITRDGSAYLSDLHYALGLEYVTTSNYVGWDSDKLLDFQFSTTMTPDGRPCLVFEYNYTKPL